VFYEEHMARSVNRSARTGRFVSKGTVARWPGKTTTERVGSGPATAEWSIGRRPLAACRSFRPQSNEASLNPLDLHPVAIETGIQTVLSTDRMDGDDADAKTSVPLRLVMRGDDMMVIRSVLVVVATASDEDAGTNSPVNLLFRDTQGQLLDEWPISSGNDSPSRLQRGIADVLRFPVGAPFTRGDVDSITMVIQGNDAWAFKRSSSLALTTQLADPSRSYLWDIERGEPS
jgi:hypothetical protein